MKRLFVSTVTAALLLMGGGAANAQGKPEKTEVHIAAASVGMTYLPMIVAESQGYFKDEGLDVTIAAFSGGSKALEALLGGSTDIVAGAYSNTLTMAMKGQTLVTFASQVNCPAWIFGIAKKNKDTVKSPKDLKGKRIGVSAPGSSTHMAVNYILHKAGLKGSDVSIIGVGQAAGAVAAIRSGQIDALIVNDPVATILVDGGDMLAMAEMRTEDGNRKVFGADYPESSLYSTKRFIDENPNTVQAVTNAIVRAERWIAKATPAQVTAAVPDKYLVEDKDLYARAFENSRRCISQTGVLSDQGAKTVRDVLAAFDPAIGTAPIDLAATYDNRFAQKAAEARP
ncbi:ABC transporter substrate-binding protein [Azospirillum canadense]|uniref:ABC transporter substrate-binding protein n=1 Tax=Azospirillum canadense TaxID=403962 RepID=UPI0022280568|nr:ABC transporter substrate-binding protein [Azospirillum canadense]MCW2241427.1 NitT/TauT family transport system substrate-binding protein [Azospirillum canadense]